MEYIAIVSEQAASPLSLTSKHNSRKNIEAAPAHDTTVMSSPLSPGDIFPTMFFTG
jgi:hypothetical protein